MRQTHILTTSPRPQRQPLSASRWLLAVTILIGQITLAFSMFAVAVALPNIMHAMSVDATSIHWVMTACQIARTVPMPALGWLSSLIGHRNLYIAGLATTVLSTVCCGLSWSLESLIFFRIIQGISAAPAQVTGMVILYQAFPPGQRGLMLGLLLLAGSLGPTIGPSLGGYLVQEYSWRAMFYLSLPTAVFSLILTPISPLTKTVLQTLPPERLSMGSGLDGIHRGFASAFGIAIGSMLLERRMVAHLIDLGETHDSLTPVVRETSAVLSDVLVHTGAWPVSTDGQALAALWNHLRQQAQMLAYQDTFLMLCGMTLLAVVPALMVRDHRSRP